MGDEMMSDPPRGSASTSLWSAECKDCRAERAVQTSKPPKGKVAAKGGDANTSFEYAGSWARRKLDRGEARSDRCERHRRAHVSAISAFAVPYVDLLVIGEVADPTNPSGPLGGLGPLPVLHREKARATDLAGQPFGMTDADILTLLNGLTDKRVAIVEAGTGTGKSTFMPFRLMNPPDGVAYRPNDFGPIVVTEPRRVAATGVARFVGEDLCYGCDSRTCARHVGPGFQVGYQVSGERHWDAACDLIYVTDGTMINWVRDGQLARMSMVIIDEAHERSENIDIILAQLRELLRQHEHLRVIITSATLDRDFFVSYFGGPEQVFQHNVPATKSFGYGTPLFINAEINDTVLENGLEIASGLKFPGWQQGSPSESDAEDLKSTTRALEKLRCVAEIPTTDWRRAMPEAVVQQVVEIARSTDWGDILAFLPTSDTIQRTVERIYNELDDLGLDFDVYPLLASTTKAITDKAIAARSRGDKRKIVISSNLAETSLTVKGIRYVVDSGLICQEEWDTNLASGSFPVKPHSQSALRQRWGRVGRDMPGWVFPLYTAEQFLSLARNTPPETSQKNLESHYMKLLSSGLDPDAMPLPGSYAAEDADVDKAGRDNIDQFERESSRARRALAAAGAIDADGHLTEFGRDIERFSGDGASALAIMLADQLACAHEVILALTVLGQGQLVGNRTEGGKSDFILAVDERWPAAWRVRAAQAHRGLALGCRDELDILLRVVSLYQTAPNPKVWCALWWVNATMIEGAIDTMMEQIDALSAAMKEDAARPIMPLLSGRARAVLSRALVSARYRRAADGSYLPAEESDLEPAKLGANVLVDVPEQILALNRFRRGRVRENGAPRPAEISHVVEFLPWAALKAGVEDIGLDLILCASQNLQHSDKAQSHLAQLVLDAIPIGTVCDLNVGQNGNVLTLDHVALPFACPVAVPNESPDHTEGRATSGFDREWDPKSERLGEAPQEEMALKNRKVQDEEINDLADPDNGELTAETPFTSIEVQKFADQLCCQTATGIHVAAGKCRGVVVGYKIAANDRISLIVDPLDIEMVLADPAVHGDVLPWEEIAVTVGRLTMDHQTSFLQLNRADGRGSFYLPEWGTGLDLYDRGFIARFNEGARLTARAVPIDKHRMSVTLLPAARALLAAAEIETRPKGETRIRVYPVSVIEDVDETGWAKVEAKQKDAASGMSFRFRVHRNDLAKSGLGHPFEGATLLVGLRPARDNPRSTGAQDRDAKQRNFLKAPTEKIAKIAATQTAFDVNGDRIRLSPSEIPFAAIANLIDASTNSKWRSDVWRFYERSLHLSVSVVYPSSLQIELPARIVSLIQFRKNDFEEQLGVTLFVRWREASVGISAPDEAAVLRASKVLQEVAALARLSVDIGNQKVGSRAIENRSDISYVWLEKGVATIAGKSQSAVREAMQQMLKPARGEIVVPQDYIGKFIGAGGANLRGYVENSGCDANSPLRDGRWELRAPAVNNIEMFLASACGKIPAASGRVIDRGELLVVPDPPRPSPQGAVTAWRGENPDFFADVSLAELERLAGAKTQLRLVPVIPPAPAAVAKAKLKAVESPPASSPSTARPAQQIPLPPRPRAAQQAPPTRPPRSVPKPQSKGGFLARLFQALFD